MKKDEVVDIMEMTLSFQRGEEKGFTYFFRELRDTLVYYSFRILNDKPVAEDVTDEAFVKIWQRHPTFKHPQVIKTWLYTTVKNASINLLLERKRKLKKNAEYLRDYVETEDQPHINRMIEAETLNLINKAFDFLPAECRRVFDSLYIKGNSVRDTASDFNLAITTIKNQKGRGLSILRKRKVHEALAV